MSLAYLIPALTQKDRCGVRLPIKASFATDAALIKYNLTSAVTGTKHQDIRDVALGRSHTLRTHSLRELCRINTGTS